MEVVADVEPLNEEWEIRLIAYDSDMDSPSPFGLAPWERSGQRPSSKTEVARVLGLLHPLQTRVCSELYLAAAILGGWDRPPGLSWADGIKAISLVPLFRRINECPTTSLRPPTTIMGAPTRELPSVASSISSDRRQISAY